MDRKKLKEAIAGSLCFHAYKLKEYTKLMDNKGFIEWEETPAAGEAVARVDIAVPDVRAPTIAIFKMKKVNYNELMISLIWEQDEKSD